MKKFIFPIISSTILIASSMTPVLAHNKDGNDDRGGRRLSEIKCDLGDFWRNHGAFVSCVAHLKLGGHFVSEAARSHIGKHHDHDEDNDEDDNALPSSAPSASPTPSASPVVSPSPGVSPTPEASPSPSASPQASASPEASPTPTVSPNPLLGANSQTTLTLRFRGTLQQIVDLLTKLLNL